MTYDLLLVGDLDVVRLTVVLAKLASVPVDEVSVAAADDGDREWDKAVLCTYESVRGEVSWSLDVYLGEAVSDPPSEAAAAAELAAGLGTPVLYSSQPYPPSAHWLVLPDGTRTRARVYDEGDALVIDAVERPVALLPGVRVEAQPEVIREHRMPTPIADGFQGPAGDRLAAWESMTERMSAGWPPDGWYPADYYREDLANRDALAEDAARLPAAFAAALTRVDDVFRSRTSELPDVPEGRGWWWGRLPDPVPWPS